MDATSGITRCGNGTVHDVNIMFLVQTSTNAASIMVGAARRVLTVTDRSLAAVGMGLCWVETD